jgi:HSP20 family protein
MEENMSLIPWGRKTTGGEMSMLSDLRTEMNRVFDNFFREPFGAMTEAFGWQDGFAPSLDVTETDKEITVQAELPGVDPKDLDITVNADRITISGEKKETIEKKEKNFHHKEIRSGKFSRTVALPAGVDTQNVTAEHKNGILTVRLNKSAQSAARKITVNGG